MTELWQRFESALLPLDSAAKLGVVLFQFPPWFYPGNEQREYILSCQEKLPQYRVAVEFRHNSWLNEKNIERTFSFLRDSRLPYVCVDEPLGLNSSVAPVAEATADIVIIRFHARNRDAWEKTGITAARAFQQLLRRQGCGQCPADRADAGLIGTRVRQMSIRIYLLEHMQAAAENRAVVEVQGRTIRGCLRSLERRFPDLKETFFNRSGAIKTQIFVEINTPRDILEQMDNRYPDDRLVRDGDQLYINVAAYIIGGMDD